MDGSEHDEIYQLGVSDLLCSVLSLKANSRLIKDLQSPNEAAWIEFTSRSSARVTIGNEEYELSFCDTKPTDAYIQEDDNQMALLGEVQGRLHVTSSRSGAGTAEGSTSTTTEKLNLYPDTEPKKREITLLEIGSGMNGLSSQSTKKAKTSHISAGSAAVPSQVQPKRKLVSAFIPHSVAPEPAQPKFDLTSSILLLGNVSVEVAASDVLSSLFSGLSVAAMYVCSHSDENIVVTETGVDGGGCSVHPASTVDLYVEFNFIGAAELAMMRDGEELSYRSLNVGENTGTSWTSPAGKSAYSRTQVVPRLQPVDQELAFWVKAAGLKLYTATVAASSSAGSGSAPQSQSLLSPVAPIRKYIEVYSNTLRIAAHGSSVACRTNTACNALYNPVSLAKHWQSVVMQWMLPSGNIDAYSSDNTQKVRISKDTKYLFSNPAVEDILLAHNVKVAGDKAIYSNSELDSLYLDDYLSDEDGCEGLYVAEEDSQYIKFTELIEEAEETVSEMAAVWCNLSLLRTNGTISSAQTSVPPPIKEAPDKIPQYDQLHVKYTLEIVNARLVLFKALFKEAWSLCTTHTVNI